MRPVTQADGYDGPRLISEFVRGLAAVTENVCVG
jgi:hypothetical protein